MGSKSVCQRIGKERAARTREFWAVASALGDADTGILGCPGEQWSFPRGWGTRVLENVIAAKVAPRL